MCHRAWILKGGCCLNMSSYLTSTIGVGSYPTTIRAAHFGYKVTVRWQWRIGSLDHGLEWHNLTIRRNWWWKYKDMMLHCIKPRIQMVILRIRCHSGFQR